MKINTKENPFAQKCRNCTPNIWDVIKNKTEELDKKCYPNTYVWIEKLKDSDKIIL